MNGAASEVDASAAVREAFRAQAEYCARLDSPFTDLLCRTLADVLSSRSEAGCEILGWRGDPAPLADNLPLRVVGALHALARSGKAPELASIYPPAPLPAADLLADVLRRALQRHAAEILAFLPFTPQTNEVGRSAVLIGGLLEIARRTGLPVNLYEIGSSAGLNLLADRYAYRLDGADWGAADARLRLVPEWKGPPPPVDAELTVREGHGCDLHPIDLRDPAQRERLRGYVWADQTERLERLNAAIETALTALPQLERADAAEWVERRIAAAPAAGVARVLLHSVVWNYLTEETRRRIAQQMERAGTACRSDAPLAWLHFELNPRAEAAQLRLTMWPGGREQLLAAAHPHGASVHWVA